MTKQELAELVLTKEELKNIDYAYPQPWADKMREMGIQPFYYVWSYINGGAFGEPLNLAERFVRKFSDLPETISNADLDKERVSAMYSTLSLVNEALKL